MSYRSVEKPMGGRHIVRTADGAVIPNDVGNQDYLAFRAWLESGNELVYEERPLDAVKRELHAKLDNDAENRRMRYLTPGTGMSMTYAEKRDQANAVHSMGEAAATAMSAAEQVEQFPTLAASVGLEAPTLWACALLVIAKSEAWATLSHAIERTRLLGKKAISDASDAASARAAYEAIEWTV
jgi:hypothetical protein